MRLTIFLLALSEGGQADYLVTGDKSGLLALGRHKATRIVSAREFAGLLARTSGGSRMPLGSIHAPHRRPRLRQGP